MMLKDKIELLLKIKNISMEKLAADIKLTRSGLSRALKNETISYKHLKLICQILKISFADLEAEILPTTKSTEERLQALEIATGLKTS